MNKKLLVGMAAGIVIVFTMGLVIGYVAPRFWSLFSQRPIHNSANLIKQIQTVSELVTVKYVVEKVVVLEDVKWVAYLGESRVLMLAHGVVKAGIDLSRIREGDIEIDGKKVIIRLPPARVMEAYLDEKQTRIIERTTGFLRMFDKDLEQNARVQAVSEIKAAAYSGGINKEAELRAKAQLTTLFKSLGFATVEFKAR